MAGAGAGILLFTLEWPRYWVEALMEYLAGYSTAWGWVLLGITTLGAAAYSYFTVDGLVGGWGLVSLYRNPGLPILLIATALALPSGSTGLPAALALLSIPATVTWSLISAGLYALSYRVIDGLPRNDIPLGAPDPATDGLATYEIASAYAVAAGIAYAIAATGHPILGAALMTGMIPAPILYLRLTLRRKRLRAEYERLRREACEYRGRLIELMERDRARYAGRR